jgi:serine/threonine protein phosphatase 1
VIDGDRNSGECRLFAVADIHGCSTALRKLIEVIDPGPEDTIVILGDFIDCGADSKGVIEQLIDLTSRCQLIPILGNHEEMLLNALDSKSEYRYWLKLGGKQTLMSYSPYRTDLEVIPPEHVRFIRGCRNYFETDTHIFLHANYDHERPISWTSGTKLRWEHPELNRLRPHCSGKTVVVGHTPQVNGQVLDLGFLVAIDTDCCRGGWLTGMRIGRGQLIQSNERGSIRRACLMGSRMSPETH